MSNDAFRAELAAQMAARRMTGHRLAHAAGMDPSQVSRLLSGRRDPHPESVEALADALNLDDHDTLRLHVLASLPERYHHRVRLDEARVIPVDVLMTRLEQAGIGGRDAA